MAGELKRGMRIVVATHNEGKVRELAELFAPLGVETLSAGGLGLLEPEETGATFAANAMLKAEAAATASDMVAIADDSGLEVAALGGEPGIHSARWGGPARDFGLAMDRVNRALEASGAKDRRANFTCALALAGPDAGTKVFTGKIFGTLVWPPRGSRGFGYDPIFVPDGESETFGQIDPRRKNAMSHRQKAFDQLIQATWQNNER